MGSQEKKSVNPDKTRSLHSHKWVAHTHILTGTIVCAYMNINTRLSYPHTLVYISTPCSWLCSRHLSCEIHVSLFGLKLCLFIALSCPSWGSYSESLFSKVRKLFQCLASLNQIITMLPASWYYSCPSAGSVNLRLYIQQIYKYTLNTSLLLLLPGWLKSVWVITSTLPR